ncbi:glutaminyl-tRNA synthase (glutamine-hydrolyzing) subunit A [Candidatus Roizmanbacteria bacterium RIFCSPHIGHO2_01_FULL_39_12c]|uniref:Glutamyl-tRNA(Gln) amidotransferase subunit A n=1 Tax=Candidatus Roizmanbacteria bacterium RIFCSPHIGHO2_01_FULL_39_12c TaxID=1802031 RepID=A0A1F7GEP5_9BACT|nr:MAG: glutaminyl-tRNA synthase (glutamine-hydrolyzing) subunit A [Candidatus Roizmanbacteria bacterium RIFCSPHIGHO2_01_FULL_39_12c]OGK48092.1 MAG: glutaminyl-tRNA synthase (glutamine-hydrolyzing) subunit A [Candidatus Roizmanbacteria bacterium RIFCSPLOWO2_01_FULL_40_13]
MNLHGKSLLELRQLLTDKKISEKELNLYFLKRIKKYNPKLNAFITVLENNHSGIPYGAKDIFCTKGIRTTAAAKVLDNFIPPYESTVTRKLQEAGMAALGKTNMDAWAHGASTETSDYGVTKNPWDNGRYPGGSSGGSAAAISAYLVSAAIGTDTGGSIRHPSAWCGVIGLKPTYGRVSRYGVIAMGSSWDCPGPMTLTVEDNAYLLKQIAGQDKYDATSSGSAVPDYSNEIKKNKKFKIGIAESYFDGIDDQIKNQVYKAIKVLKKLGHSVKPIKLLPPKYSISVYTILQRAEVSSNLSRYDGVRYGNDRSFFGQEAKRRIMLGTYTLSYGYYDAYYKNAQKVRTIIIENFKSVFKDVDLIVGPNTPVTALKIGEFDKYPFYGELMDQLNEPASTAGIPDLSIPVGLDSHNLPIGFKIMGNYFDEANILNLAYQFEKETDFFGVIKKGIERYKD